MGFDAAVDELLARGAGRMIPDLRRITRLAELLGEPQLAYPSVHVTGTNGKGSTVRMVTTLLSATGLKAGTYTSPHLQTIRERIAVAGRPISERRFAEVYDEVRPFVDLVDADRADPRDHVTYFEYLTAMAYWAFADEPVDVGVFEVGMGGRWDATNLIRGDVSVITNVDVDHPQLGSTPVEVAREKVGIIKPGNQVVTAPQADEVMRVIEAAAAEQDATVVRAGIDFDVERRRVAVGGQDLTLRVGDRRIDDVFLPAHGEHQARNAAIALQAVASFLGAAFDRIDDDLIRQAFAAVTLPGRLEVVHRDPTVVIDGAHNPHGARTVAAAIGESFGFRNLVVVLACLADKDVRGIVEAFGGQANHVVVTLAPSGRATDVDTMTAIAADVWAGTGVIVESAEDLDEAIDLACGLAGDGDGVLVTGSLYTVGAARDRFLPVSDPGDEVVYEPGDVDSEDDEAAFNEALERMLDEIDGSG